MIGSVHVIADDTAVEGEAGCRDAGVAWGDYLDRLVAAAASGAYDVISHPVRLAQSQPDAPAFVAARLDDLAEAAARADVALEINGTDLERRPDLVAAARRRLRAPLDGRQPRLRRAPAAEGRARARRRPAAAPAAGIDQIVAFERRTRIAVPLPA